MKYELPGYNTLVLICIYSYAIHSCMYVYVYACICTTLLENVKYKQKVNNI